MAEGEKLMAERLCLRCGKPVYRKGQKYHYECRELADAELRAKIEAIPEKPMTQEAWERMWGQKMPPFERQHD